MYGCQIHFVNYSLCTSRRLLLWTMVVYSPIKHITSPFKIASTFFFLATLANAVSLYPLYICTAVEFKVVKLSMNHTTHATFPGTLTCYTMFPVIFPIKILGIHTPNYHIFNSCFAVSISTAVVLRGYVKLSKQLNYCSKFILQITAYIHHTDTCYG